METFHSNKALLKHSLFVPARGSTQPGASSPVSLCNLLPGSVHSAPTLSGLHTLARLGVSLSVTGIFEAWFGPIKLEGGSYASDLQKAGITCVRGEERELHNTCIIVSSSFASYRRSTIMSVNTACTHTED